jgi:hypothetical protein
MAATFTFVSCQRDFGHIYALIVYPKGLMSMVISLVKPERYILLRRTLAGRFETEVGKE